MRVSPRTPNHIGRAFNTTIMVVYRFDKKANGNSFGQVLIYTHSHRFSNRFTTKLVVFPKKYGGHWNYSRTEVRKCQFVLEYILVRIAGKSGGIAAFSVSPRAHFTSREAEMFSEVGMEQDHDGYHVV